MRVGRAGEADGTRHSRSELETRRQVAEGTARCVLRRRLSPFHPSRPLFFFIHSGRGLNEVWHLHPLHPSLRRGSGRLGLIFRDSPPLSPLSHRPSMAPSTEEVAPPAYGFEGSEKRLEVDFSFADAGKAATGAPPSDGVCCGAGPSQYWFEASHLDFEPPPLHLSLRSRPHPRQASAPSPAPSSTSSAPPLTAASSPSATAPPSTRTS